VTQLLGGVGFGNPKMRYDLDVGVLGEKIRLEPFLSGSSLGHQ
jgi:hypothetical protein